MFWLRTKKINYALLTRVLVLHYKKGCLIVNQYFSAEISERFSFTLFHSEISNLSAKRLSSFGQFELNRAT